MNQLLTFALEMLLVSATFCIGYLIIRSNTTPTFKRAYLLIWMALSVTLPLISIEFEQSPDITLSKVIQQSTERPSFNLPLDDVLVEDVAHPDQLASNSRPASAGTSKKETSWPLIVSVAYLLVSFLLMLRIGIGILQIFKLRAKSTVIKDDIGLIYLVENPSFKGASFFNWIFLGSEMEDKDLIVQHERIHSRLFHSYDILFSHIYVAVFWLNPFAWFVKKHIALNAEIQVDEYILKTEKVSDYANILLALSAKQQKPTVMNYFGAFYLKSRILALSQSVRHRHWVSFLSAILFLIMFVVISCEGVNSSELMTERLNDVKTITTRFISHQSDTQQKTGKVVAIASFAVDGTLEELVEQTTYPYDREFEVKKDFWEAPKKSGIAYVMDGLSLGNAEKSFLYGHDWPSAYYKHLKSKVESRDMPWNEVVEVDNELLPQEIITRREIGPNEFFGLGMPDVTEYFDYEDEKVVKVLSKSEYKNLEYDDDRNKALGEVVRKNETKEMKEMRESMRRSSGKVKLVATYEYDGQLLTSIKHGKDERRFYYENNLMVRSEFLRSGEVINTRIHYYKNSLKDRTEIFNRYNEPEYTITYEYEFW